MTITTKRGLSNEFREMLLAALALWICSCNPVETPSHTDAQSAVEKVLHAQGVAWNRGDLEGFMSAYEASENLLFTSGGTVRRGYQETLEKYRAKYGEPGAMGKLAFKVIDFRLLSAQSAVMLGSWKLTETPMSGEGVFTLVWFKTTKGWMIVHDHTSLGSQEEPTP